MLSWVEQCAPLSHNDVAGNHLLVWKKISRWLTKMVHITNPKIFWYQDACQESLHDFERYLLPFSLQFWLSLDGRLVPGGISHKQQTEEGERRVDGMSNTSQKGHVAADTENHTWTAYPAITDQDSYITVPFTIHFYLLLPSIQWFSSSHLITKSSRLTNKSQSAVFSSRTCLRACLDFSFNMSHILIRLSFCRCRWIWPSHTTTKRELECDEEGQWLERVIELRSWR